LTDTDFLNKFTHLVKNAIQLLASSDDRPRLGPGHNDIGSPVRGVSPFTGIDIDNLEGGTKGHTMAIITISRGSYAGGKALAERLSEQLGSPCLGREQLLSHAAGEYGILEAELTDALNSSPPLWQQLPGKRLAYVKCVTAALLDHASHGSLVYHGHVGHLLLSGISHVCRVRVIADLEYRIKAAMEHGGLTRDKALAYIRRVDEDRSRWAQLLYGMDWQDPTQYHLVVNLSLCSMDSASEAIVRLSQMEEFEPTAESWKRFEDLRLSCKVWAAVAKHPDTRSAGIQVEADDGAVVISGKVSSVKAMELVPRIASEVEGVKSIRCDAGVGTDWYW
jgi:cytidylate kinase